MKISIFVFSLCLGVVLTGCGTTIARNLRAANGNWTVEILKVRDGPNSVSAPYVSLMPKRGFHFIWLTVQIQNNTNITQDINLDDFGLVYDQTLVAPFYHLFDVWLYIPASRDFTLKPGESVRRRIVYSIPIDKQPRLVRVPNVGDIPIKVLQVRDGTSMRREAMVGGQVSSLAKMAGTVSGSAPSG